MELHKEKCPKCKGSGTFVSYSGRPMGQCFTCAGVGFKEFKASAADRAKARASTSARKQKVVDLKLSAFAEAEPAIWAWIEEARGGFEFAQAMHDAVAKFGSLTEKQTIACLSAIEKREIARAKAKERIEKAPEVTTDKLMAAFDAAKGNGIKRPKMRFEGFVAMLAPSHSTNAGAIYVKDGEEYLGKIAGGKFFASKAAGPQVCEAIVATMNDPLSAAVAYGRKTGTCSICARELTNGGSIEAGIGPICASKFAF